MCDEYLTGFIYQFCQWLGNPKSILGVMLPLTFSIFLAIYRWKDFRKVDVSIALAILVISFVFSYYTGYKRTYFGSSGHEYESLRIFAFFPILFIFVYYILIDKILINLKSMLPIYLFIATFINLIVIDILLAKKYFIFYLSGIGGAGIIDGLIASPLIMFILGLLYVKFGSEKR